MPIIAEHTPPPKLPAATHGRALLVVLENVGHISGLDLPAWAMSIVDNVTEEYAKLVLRLLGT